jgi:AGZA family xanthine/uracil permease-like MFS transporter
MRDLLDRYFGLSQHGTSVRQEVVAGSTTFLAMAYITVVNPGILATAGMDFGAVFVATCLAAALGTLVMGLYANYPVGQAPGMGQNVFFTYGIVLGVGVSWQTALGAVFISGVLFIILSLLPIREWLINAIPRSLKLGIAAGIGLFLGIIALSGSGVIVANPATLVTLGDLTQAPALFLLGGFALIVALAARRVPGAVILGMLLVTLIGWLTGSAEFKGLVSPPPPLTTLLELDIVAALDLSIVTVILTILLVDLFDTAGTLLGVAHRAGLLDEKGQLPRLRRALLADSGATTAGALLGTSSTTSFIESAAGVEAGGRTGLTAVTAALLFLGCLFFAPLAASVPGFATGAALLFVACLMTRALRDLDWDDIGESAPALVTFLGIPLTYSIANGIGLGFINYVLIRLLSGRGRDCHPAVYLVALIFVLKFGFLG